MRRIQHIQLCVYTYIYIAGMCECAAVNLCLKVNTYEIKVNDWQIASKRIATTLVARSAYIYAVAPSTNLLRYLRADDLFRLRCFYAALCTYKYVFMCC